MGSFGGYDLGDSGIVGLLVGLLVVLLAFFFFPRKSAPRKKTVLLLGNVGSGKTTLFFQLRDGGFRQCQTSMRANDESFVPSAMKSSIIRFIDFPGHGSQRLLLGPYLPACGKIIFVIDVTDISQCQSIAEFLFQLMGNPLLSSSQVPILLAFNKSDDASEVKDSQDQFISKIELYIEKTRKLQGSMADIGSETQETESIAIGKQGEQFRLEHSPLQVTTCQFSAKLGQIDAIKKFVRR